MGSAISPAARAAAGAPVFRAGAATSNITPLFDVLLDGPIMQIGPAKSVHDEIHARCLVLDDGTERVALVVCDTTMIAQFVIDHAKALIAEQSKLPAHRVVISATHTHSTPRAIGISDQSADRAYLDFLARRIADAVQRAINNLAPAKIGWGSVAKPEYVHNRRWFVANPEKRTNPFGVSGEEVGMNPGRTGLIKPAGPVDPEVSVVSVRHADGRPLAVFANYGLHYIGGVPAGTISADYYGVFCDRIQELLRADRQDPPFVGIMSNGTSGDVNAVDSAAAPKKFKAYERMTQVAHDLAAAVRRVCDQIEYRDWVPLAAQAADLPLRIRKPDAARLQWAQPLQVAGAAKSVAGRPLTRPEIYAREAGFLAQYPERVTLRLQAIRIGDLGIGAIPNEVFAETGLAIKQGSPFKATFTIELANGYYGYLPTPQQHQWGGYETWDARSSCLEVGAEPAIRETVLELLRAVRKTSG
jgi:hypothetical protein